MHPFCSFLKKKQKTIRQAVSMSGNGLFTGSKVAIFLKPSGEGSGITFVRADLPGSPSIPADIDYVKETPRSTILEKDGVIVRSVEHILSACKALEIDNIVIEMHGDEIPAVDGSASPFVSMLLQAGTMCQLKERSALRLLHPIFWSRNDAHLIALPSYELRISYTLSYPNSRVLHSQFCSFYMNEETYKKEIAPARTFCLYDDIVSLIEKGLIKGGNLENAVVIKGDTIINPEGLRFANNEMARHKALDLLGDLSLLGKDFPSEAHIIGIRSGHSANIAFAREIRNYIQTNMGKDK